MTSIAGVNNFHVLYIKMHYLLVCLDVFVLFFGVSEIDFNLFNGLQMLGSFTRMIL